MGTVSYDGKLIIPAPIVNISKQYQKTEDGQNIGSLYTLTFTGTMVAYLGSPYGNGKFTTGPPLPSAEVVPQNERLGALLRKQEALQHLFSQEGKNLEVQSLDGSTPFKCQPRILSIDFPEGQWHTVMPYTITLECDNIDKLETGQFATSGDIFEQYISSANETWSIDTNEQPEGLGLSRTYTLSHTVSAIGKRKYKDDGSGDLERDAYLWAKDFVDARLGFNRVLNLESGVNLLPSYYGGYNHFLNENINKLGGEYSVTETWLIASGSALEDFTVNTQTSLESLSSVSIEGTITGLEVRGSGQNINDIIVSKYDNALTRFVVASGLAYARAQTYSNLSNLNIKPLSTTIGKNPIAGTINYSFGYDTRPTALTNAKTEQISISDNLGTDIFASFGIPGRAAGPIYQDMNTSGELVRSLSIELLLEPPLPNTGSIASKISTAIAAKPDVSDIINAVDPLQNGFTQAFKRTNTENWSLTAGTYSRQIEWVYQ